MELIDPLKSSRRLAAQKNAEKVRLQPFDHVDKSVQIVNKWESHILDRNLDAMDREEKITQENLDREKKHFVYTSRKKLKKAIPGLRQTHDQGNGENGGVFDSDLLRIVQFYEEKNPSIIKHSSSEQDLRKIQNHRSLLHKVPRVKLEPLNPQLSSSLQDLSTKTLHKNQFRKKPHKGLVNTARLQVVNEKSIAHLRYSNRDGHSEDEKEELRKRKIGVISCPAFYLETGNLNLSRESPFKVHSSMDRPLIEMSEDEEDLSSAAATGLMVNNYQSRSTSRATNRFETPTPALISRGGGRDSKLSMSHERVNNDKSNVTRSFGTGRHTTSPVRRSMSRNTRTPHGGEDNGNKSAASAATISSTEKSYKQRGFLQGRSLLQSQESYQSRDTLGSNLSTELSPVNTLKSSGISYLTSLNRNKSISFRHKKITPSLPTTKVYHVKPQTEPSLEVQDILDKHLHPIPPVRQKVLPQIARNEPAQSNEDNFNNDNKKQPSPESIRTKRNKSPSKYFKNDKLISSFLVPSDVKKICSDTPFDPYALALNQSEIDEIETNRRSDTTGQRLDSQREIYATAQGNVQHWVKDLDNQLKKEKMKYITNF